MENTDKLETSETKTDYRVSWHFFKKYYKSFIATEIFAILAFIIVNGIILGIIISVFALSPNLDPADLLPRTAGDFGYTFLIYGFIAIIAYLTMSGFLYCQFGLAYDIFTSGDMFTEFKKAFHYFKAHWWKYILLTFVTGFGFFIPDCRMGFNAPEPLPEFAQFGPIIFVVVRFVVLFVIILLFSATLPSVTAQGNLKNSFIEAIRIFKKDYKRLLKTWGLYHLVFTVPVFSVSLTMTILMPVIEGTFWVWILMGIMLILYFYKLFIGFPMMSLLATRIYNSVEFERFKPLPNRMKKVLNTDKMKEEDLK